MARCNDDRIYEQIGDADEVARMKAEMLGDPRVSQIVQAALSALDIGASPVPIAGDKAPLGLDGWNLRSDEPVTEAELICEFYHLYTQSKPAAQLYGWGDVLGGVVRSYYCTERKRIVHLAKMALDIDIPTDDCFEPEWLEEMLQSEFLPRSHDGKLFVTAKVARKGITISFLRDVDEMRSTSYHNRDGHNLMDILGYRRQTVMPPSHYAVFKRGPQLIDQYEPMSSNFEGMDKAQIEAAKETRRRVTHYDWHDMSVGTDYVSPDQWPEWRIGVQEEFLGEVAFICDGCIEGRQKKGNDMQRAAQTAASAENTSIVGTWSWLNMHALTRLGSWIEDEDLAIKDPELVGNGYVCDPWHRVVASQGRSLKLRPATVSDKGSVQAGGIVDFGLSQMTWSPCQFVSDRLQIMAELKNAGVKDFHTPEAAQQSAQLFDRLQAKYKKEGREEAWDYYAYEWLMERTYGEELAEAEALVGDLDAIFDATRSGQESRRIERQKEDMLPAVVDEGELAVKLNPRRNMSHDAYKYATPWIKRYMDLVKADFPDAPYEIQVAPALHFLPRVASRHFYAHTDGKLLWLSFNFVVLMDTGLGKEIVMTMPEKLVGDMERLKRQINQPEVYFDIAQYSDEEWLTKAEGEDFDEEWLVSRPLANEDTLDALWATKCELEKELDEIGLMVGTPSDSQLQAWIVKRKSEGTPWPDDDKMTDEQWREKYTRERKQRAEAARAELDEVKENIKALRRRSSPISVVMDGVDDATGESAIRKELSKRATFSLVRDELGDVVPYLLGDGGANNPAGRALIKAHYYAKRLKRRAFSNSGSENETPHILDPAVNIYGAATPDKWDNKFKAGDLEDGTLNRINAVRADINPDYNARETARRQMSEGSMSQEALPDDFVEGSLRIFYGGHWRGYDPVGYYRNSVEMMVFPFLSNRDFWVRLRRDPDDRAAIENFFVDEIEPLARRSLAKFEDSRIVRNAVPRVREQVHRVAHLAAISEYADPDVFNSGRPPLVRLSHYRWAWAVVEPSIASLLTMVTRSKRPEDVIIQQIRVGYARALIKALSINGKAVTNRKIKAYLRDKSHEQLDPTQMEVGDTIFVSSSTIADLEFRTRTAEGKTGKATVGSIEWGKARRALQESAHLHKAIMADGGTSKKGHEIDLICFSDIEAMARDMYDGRMPKNEAALIRLANYEDEDADDAKAA